MTEDLSKHLPLINRVIRQLNLRGDMAEEAFSEGLVVLTEASQKYDPSHEVPLVNWLGLNLRWSLMSWLDKQHHTVPLPTIAGKELESLNTRPDHRVELKETLARMETLLTYQERQVIIALALGYTGEQIAKALDITPVKVSRLKKKAREKLKSLK